jgi:bacterioferritin-associated ferredoxin
MELDDDLCLCFHVKKRKILNFIRIHRPRVPSQVSECGSAGTGCGWCIPFLKKCYREVMESDETAAEPTSEEYARSRGQYIKEGKGIPPPGAEPIPED